MECIEIEDFAEAFGTSVEDVREKCGELISSLDFTYATIVGNQRDSLILKILKRIHEDTQIIGANNRTEVWEQGWKENLDLFVSNQNDLDQLTPKFIRHGAPIRYKKAYVQPIHPKFELNYVQVFRQWLFKTYFGTVSHVYEFGCGTGFNLVALGQLFPNTQLVGSDFVQSSVDLVNKIGQTHKFNLSSRFFDMISPDQEFKLERGSGVFTIGSIEQLASQFDSFIQYLRKQPISICFHVEPMIELYEDGNLVDYLAIRFQSKRGYTQNLVPYLKDLHEKGEIELLKIKRFYFGSLFMEGYNLVVWKPR